jgi:hypothetical protein
MHTNFICVQCGKLEPLHAFDGTKRSCRVQLAKRRASSFNKGSAASSSTAVTSSLSKTVSGGIRKVASISGNMDKLALLNGQLSEPQMLLTQQQQQGYTEFSEPQELQETDLSGKLFQLKQQVAFMEQQLALLQEQQQMEAELIALQQQYQHTLEDARLQSSSNAEAISAPLGSMGFGSRSADRTLSAPVPCLSAPVCAPSHAPVVRRPSLGASAQTWSAAAPGMMNSMQPLSGPLMQSYSTPLPTAAGAAAAAAGFGAMGHGPGWLPYDSCVSNCTVMSSNSLNLQHLMPPAAAAAAQAQLARPQHTDIWSVAHSMQMNNIPMGNDVPELQEFIAAGGRLQGECASTNQHLFCNDSSPSNSLGGSYSPERSPAGPHAFNPANGTAARVSTGGGSLERVHEHAEMLPAPMQAAVPMQATMGNSFGPQAAHSNAAFAHTLEAGQGNNIPFGRRSLETFAGEWCDWVDVLTPLL